MLDLAEIKALLSVMENLKHRALLTITYSAGLRVSEAAKLKVTDIDSKRMMVRVQQVGVVGSEFTSQTLRSDLPG
jgi:site-specific recombinase XerD